MFRLHLLGTNYRKTWCMRTSVVFTSVLWLQMSSFSDVLILESWFLWWFGNQRDTLTRINPRKWIPMQPPQLQISDLSAPSDSNTPRKAAVLKMGGSWEGWQIASGASFSCRCDGRTRRGGKGEEKREQLWVRKMSSSGGQGRRRGSARGTHSHNHASAGTVCAGAAAHVQFQPLIKPDTPPFLLLRLLPPPLCGLDAQLWWKVHCAVCRMTVPFDNSGLVVWAPPPPLTHFIQDVWRVTQIWSENQREHSDTLTIRPYRNESQTLKPNEWDIIHTVTLWW